MGSFFVWEALSCMNTRSSLGRVVVNPPKKIPPVVPKKGTGKWYFCKCGRAFSDLPKLEQHRETHPKKFSVDWTPSRHQDEEIIMHKCMHCGKILASAPALRNHIYIHTGEKPWQCDKCPAVFRLYSTLYDHKRVSHVAGGKFRCAECPCRFTAQLGLKRHLGIYHCKMNLQAVVTPKNKPSKISNKVPKPDRGRVTSTVFTEDGTRTYPCHYCGKVFFKSQYLRNHYPVHTGERKSVCHLCGVGFKSSSNLLAHKKVSHVEGGKHKCERCTCIFASLLGLVRHRRLLHGIGNNMPVASVAANKLKRAKIMRAPLKFAAARPSRVVVEEDDNEDSGDEENESGKDVLSQEPNDDGNYECKQCGKVLASLFGLRNHILIHSGAKPEVCDLCGLSFRLKSTLHGHKKSSHVPNGPFKCDQCPCAFAAKFGLRRHNICFHENHDPQNDNMVHTRTVKCQLCGKTFQNFSALQQHLLTHSSDSDQDRPVKCPQCDCTYSSKRSLRKHSKSAHVPGGKKCPKCACSFITNQARKSHHTKMHVRPNLTSLNRAPVSPLRAKAPNRHEYVSIEDEIMASAKVQHDPVDALKCSKCDKIFGNQISLKNHRRLCVQGTNTCEFCDESFSLYSNMIRHKRSCHVQGGPYPCSQCTHCYATSKGISRHFAKAHGLYKKDRIALARGLTITRVAGAPKSKGVKPGFALNRIIQNSKMRIIKKRKPYVRVPEALRKHQCLLCGNFFSTSGNYKKHMQTSHVPGGQFPCTSCACVFNTYNALNSHTGNRHSKSRESLEEDRQTASMSSTKPVSPKRALFHSTQKPMPQLSKIKFNFFRQNSNSSLPDFPTARHQPGLPRKNQTALMKRMALIVGGNSPPKDMILPEGIKMEKFTSSPNRKLQPEIPISALFGTSGVPKCDLCGKTYSNMNTLKSHMSVHTGEKPWPCDQCDQMFRQKGDVVSHKKTNHSKDGKFKCNQCPCRFISSQGIKRHMVLIHTDNDDQEQLAQPPVPQISKQVKAPAVPVINAKIEKPELSKTKVTLTFASEAPKPKMAPGNGSRAYNCDLCDASFNHVQNLLRHRKSSHVPWGEFKCSSCSCSFVSPTSLRTHEVIFHQGRKGNNILKYKKEKHGSVKPAPRLNQSVTAAVQPKIQVYNPSKSNPSTIPKLIVNSKGKTFLCELCGATFKNHSNCSKHMQNSHVDGGHYACGHCPCIFGNLKGLTRHESIYHTRGNNSKKQFLTEIPQETFQVEIDNDGDDEHEEKADSEGHGDGGSSEVYDEENATSIYEEQETDDHGESSEIFENHFEDEEECLVLRESGSNEVDPLATSSGHHDDHLNICTPKLEGVTIDDEEEEIDDPFLQPDLEALQARIPALTVTKVETSSPDFEAIKPRSTVFGDGAVLQKERVNRFAIYSKKELHVCKICKMTFTQLGGLKGHMRIHTGDKPYQCRYCGICFRLNGTLATHIKKCHEQSNPFQCEYCTCQFVTAGVLTQHIIKYHPEQAVPVEEA